jgi:predicted Kef-type K+ transport protein
MLSADKLPSVVALALLALPLLRPLLSRLLMAAGHDELLVLFGIGLALGGAELFELVNLKGGLGALVFGVLLSHCSKSTELYRSLISFKDLFLIGFFVQIGFYGLPSAPMIVAALALTLLIFLRPLIYFFLFVAFGLRARTAMLTGLSLFNYSEFGLLVAAIAVASGGLPSEWLTTLALALSLSFFVATPFNTRVHSLYSRYSGWLHRF